MIEPNTKKSSLKQWKLYVTAFFGCALFAFLLLPTLLSTPFGKKQAISWLEKKFHIQLEIDVLSLSWFNSQKIEGMRGKTSSTPLSFSCDLIQTDISLFNLVFQKKYNGETQVYKGKISLLTQEGQEGGFDPINASFFLSDDQTVVAKVEAFSEKGQLNLDLNGSHLFSSHPTSDLKLIAQQFPLEGIDCLLTHFSSFKLKEFLPFLGLSLDMFAHLQIQKGNWDIDINAHSDTCSIEINAETQNESVVLKKPGLFVFQSTPYLASALSPSVILKTDQYPFLKINLLHFSLPIQEKIPLKEAWKKAVFLSDLQLLTPLSLKIQNAFFSLAPFHFKVSSQAIEKGAQIETALDLSIPPSFSPFLGNQLFLQTKGQLDLLSSFSCDLLLETKTDQPLVPFSDLKAHLFIKTLDQMMLNIKSPMVNANLFGSYDLRKKTFKLTKPFISDWTLSSQFLEKFLPHSPFLKLSTPLKMICQIEPTQFLWTDSHSLNTLKAKGNCDIESFTLQTKEPTQEITFLKTQLPFQWNGKTQSGSIQCTSFIDATEGAIQAEALFSHVDLATKNAEINVNLNLKTIPTPLLALSFGKEALIDLIGPRFTTQIKLESTSSKKKVLIDWVSQYLKLNTAFDIDGSTIQIKQPNQQIQWMLTPQGYLKLDQLINSQSSIQQTQNPFSFQTVSDPFIAKKHKSKPSLSKPPAKLPVAKSPPPFALKEETQFLISLKELYLPLTQKRQIDLSQLQLNLSVKNANIHLTDLTSQEEIELTSTLGSLQKKGIITPLICHLETSVLTEKTPSQNAKKGSCIFESTLFPTYDSESNFDFSKLSSQISLKMQQFPTRALDFIARAKGITNSFFSSLFGPSIDAVIGTDLQQFNGPVSATINSPNARVFLSGDITKGFLRLKDTFHAQIQITPQVSQLILKEVNPFDLSSFYSQDPLTVEILPENASLPLFPFDLAKLSLPNIKIELGKIYCKNEGNVNITLGLLKSQELGRDQDLNLWFAPIDLHIQQGLIDLERTEILLNHTFDIALWGKLNLVQDTIDMLLGLTANTLRKAFGVKNLPENYVLTIPLRGKMDNVKIDTGKATGKIALLLAWQQADAAGAFAGGPAGAIVGGLLSKMTTLPDKDAKVPPAKHPFPWETGKKNKKSTSHLPHEKRRHFKQKDKPLKQLLKVIR